MTRLCLQERRFFFSARILGEDAPVPELAPGRKGFQ